MPEQTAQELAKEQKEISVSEFFEKNRHLLGYDNKIKALLIIVKEGVDNSLDVTEEVGTLPEIYIKIEELEKEKYRIVIKDNGPGIIKKQIPKIFGTLLYGSKFHKLRQSLTGDEPIFILNKGKAEITPIGELIDGYIEEKEGVVDVSGKDLSVPAFDNNGRYGLRKVSHLIKHARNNEIIEFQLSTNKKIRVTGCHSLFTLDPETFKPKATEARDIREGDFIIAPRRLPAMGDITEINVLDYLKDSDIRDKWFYVYGIDRDFLTQLFGSCQKIHKKVDRSRAFYRIKTADGYEDIVEEKKTYYTEKGFLPLQLVLKLGMNKEFRDCSIQSYFHGKETRFPVSLELNESFMRFLGLFVAEGHTDKRHIGFTFGRHEDHLIDEIMRFARIHGLNASIVNRKTSIRVLVFGGLLSILMRRWCGRGAKNKQIPEFIFRANRRNRGEFLRYLYFGDGHTNSRYSVLHTTSERLANETSYLLLMQGIVATLSKRTCKGLGKTPSICHMVYIFNNRQKKGMYDLFPSELVKEFEPKKKCLFRASRAFEALKLGYKKSIREKYYQIMSIMTSEKPYSFYDIEELIPGRITKFHTKYLRDLGYLKESNGMFLVTEKAKRLLERIEMIRGFQNNDLCLLKVKTKTVINEGYDYVYDISVPDCENFVGGFGGVSCHNSRGQQGLGISCAVLYSQLTTGEPTEVLSSLGDGTTQRYRLKIDVKKNEPVVLEEDTLEGKDWHGVQITFICEGIYREHHFSVLEYLKETAISNPFATIIFDSPTGRFEFRRGVDTLPPKPKEILPHLYGIEVGIMSRMVSDTKARTVLTFLTSEFSRIGKLTAKEICTKANINPVISPKKLRDDEIVNLVKVIKETKLTRPPTDCLSPLGEKMIQEGLKKELSPEFIAVVSRPPAVYRGWPFQIESGICFAGTIQEPKFMRFANRVPLLYQAGDCAIMKAMSSIDWKRYGIEADKTPIGPVGIFVHMASVWVPFTSESKEAIANYPVIIKEIKLSLQECARKLGLYLSGIRKAQALAERKMIFERYAAETAMSIHEITGEPAKQIEEKLLKIIETRWGEIDGDAEEPARPKKHKGDNGPEE